MSIRRLPKKAPQVFKWLATRIGPFLRYTQRLATGYFTAG
jgi:hypothetical protein